MDIKENLNLDINLNPKNATYQNIRWESSDPQTVSISDNKLDVNGTGKVKLTAYAHNGNQDSIAKNNQTQLLQTI